MVKKVHIPRRKKMSFRDELLSAPEREWDEMLYNVSFLYIIPTKRKHESGFNCMIYVAETIKNGKSRFVRCGGYSDVLRLDDKMRCSFGKEFSIDCCKGIIRLYRYSGTFTVGRDLSTVEVTADADND